MSTEIVPPTSVLELNLTPLATAPPAGAAPVKL